MNKIFPTISVKGKQDIEKMLLIDNTLKKEHGERSRFIKEAIFEKWDRQIFHDLKKEHGVYAPLIQLVEYINDYKTFHKHGMTFEQAFKKGVISYEEVERTLLSLKFIERALLSQEVEKESVKRMLKANNK